MEFPHSCLIGQMREGL